MPQEVRERRDRSGPVTPPYGKEVKEGWVRLHQRRGTRRVFFAQMVGSGNGK